MPEAEASFCPKCGSARVEGAELCLCGNSFVATAPASPQIASNYPRASYAPGFGQVANAGPSVAERIIPTKNPKALIAYYCGVFAVVPCFSPVLGPVALILGLLGMAECKRNPALPGKGHAITGIVLGSIMTVLSLLVIGLFVFAILTKSK